jgi:hypothetical protein
LTVRKKPHWSGQSHAPHAAHRTLQLEGKTRGVLAWPMNDATAFANECAHILGARAQPRLTRESEGCRCTPQAWRPAKRRAGSSKQDNCSTCAQSGLIRVRLSRWPANPQLRLRTPVLCAEARCMSGCGLCDTRCRLRGSCCMTAQQSGKSWSGVWSSSQWGCRTRNLVHNAA